MGIVKLEGMEFYAYHGYYDEEQKMGNKYNVDLSVTVDFSDAAATDKLAHTVNYEQVYRLVKEEMGKPSRLLEHVAQRIAARVRAAYPGIHRIEVSLSKFNPPIDGICRAATIVHVQ
jgi:dihydroneopterin aldolase